MKNFLIVLGGIIFSLAIGFAGAFIYGLLFLWLWNWIVPILWTSAPILTYWECFGLALLVSFIGNLLFKMSVNVGEGD